MALKDNIKKKRKEQDMTLEELASIVGVSRQTLSRYETGVIGNIPSDKIELLAKALRTTPAYLMGWEDDTDDIFNHPDILPITKKRFPLIGGVACGEPIYREEDFESYVEAGANINADFAMRCYGNSMENIGIKDGYIVFIHKQPSVDNGEVAAVNIDGEFTLKRVYKYSDVLLLRAENPEYEDLEYREGDADNIVIMGKAVAFQGDVK